MRKIMFLPVLFFVSGMYLFAGGSSAFQVQKEKDVPLLAAGGGLVLAGIVLKNYSREPDSTPAAWLTFPTFPYSKNLADASNYVLAAGMATLPFLLDSWTWNEMETLGVMYAESMFFSWGMKESLKAVFTKYRPYTSYADTPADLMASDDRYYSFPSGHATVAFTTAGFATAVFAASDARTIMKYLFGGINFALATGVAALRVASGEHYLVDVAAGALLGTASGILIPFLHHAGDKDDSFSVSAGFGSVVLDFSY